ncbi:MAG TPA: Mov34/MPN/PAD-1 family protein [Thermoanaerobaculia bacterium]|jgi:proteasome lid subunit RPN8/RPN11
MIHATLALTLWLAGAADIEGLAAELRKHASADEDFEQAAFIVRQPDGNLSLLNWPSSHFFRKASWSGPVPPEAIGIIHTHPLRMPLPSQIDRVEATRTGLRIYVVTRVQLCWVDPHDRIECLSPKPRAKLSGVPPAADDWMSPVPEVYPE